MTDTPDPIALAIATFAVAAERQRQVREEGWIPEHDDEHAGGELLAAAVIYRLHGTPEPTPTDVTGAPAGWPWRPQWWKPRDHRSNLVRAGALCLAELERLARRPQRREQDSVAAGELLIEIIVEIACGERPPTGASGSSGLDFRYPLAPVVEAPPAVEPRTIEGTATRVLDAIENALWGVFKVDRYDLQELLMGVGALQWNPAGGDMIRTGTLLPAVMRATAARDAAHENPGEDGEGNRHHFLDHMGGPSRFGQALTLRFMDEGAPQRIGLRDLISQAAAYGFRLARAELQGEPACTVCGCTQDDACEEPVTGDGCAWAKPGVCTICAPFLKTPPVGEAS